MQVLTKYKRKTKPDSLTELKQSCFETFNPARVCASLTPWSGMVTYKAPLGPAVIRGRERPGSKRACPDSTGEYNGRYAARIEPRP